MFNIFRAKKYFSSFYPYLMIELLVLVLGTAKISLGGGVESMAWAFSTAASTSGIRASSSDSPRSTSKLLTELSEFLGPV